MNTASEKQVEATFYTFARYNDVERWTSYYYQITEVLAFKPHTVLEVGVGTGVVRSVLLAQGVTYQSLDIAEDLSPDIIGSVDAIPLPDNAVDVACAFEVLEHLPFDRFESAVKELARVARHGVVISLPHFGPPIKLLVKVPFLRQWKWAMKIPWPRVHTFNGQHYWEIGKKGYAPKKIRAILLRSLDITAEYVPFENQYHHFFVMRKR